MLVSKIHYFLWDCSCAWEKERKSWGWRNTISTKPIVVSFTSLTKALNVLIRVRKQIENIVRDNLQNSACRRTFIGDQRERASSNWNKLISQCIEILFIPFRGNSAQRSLQTTSQMCSEDRSLQKPFSSSLVGMYCWECNKMRPCDDKERKQEFA